MRSTPFARIGLVGVTALFTWVAAASAQTITVTMSAEDVADFGGLQRVADLPGPDGLVSFREAVTAASNTPGPQTIVFAIPQSEWDTTIYSDRVLIRQEYMAYVGGDDTTIDFTTQTAFTGDTNPTGNEVALYYAGPPAGIPNIWLAGNRCVVKGVDWLLGNNVSEGLWITGNDCRVIGCTTTAMKIRGDYGGGANNIIGGTLPGEGNIFTDGVGIYSHANNNVVIGNLIEWGLQISGDTYWGTCDNNRIGGPTAAERNTISGKGYYAEEGFPTGTQVSIGYVKNTIIEGNYIGTTTDGSAKYPGNSGSGGIGVDIGSVGTIIRNNLVSGIAMDGINHYAGQRFGVAIGVAADAQGTLITGNRVGVAADGVTSIPNIDGIVVISNPNGAPDVTQVGGIAPGEGNLIANSEVSGVRVASTLGHVRVSGNSIRDNGSLGIDLTGGGLLGVTLNDVGDGDTGPNGLQNFPVLSSASSSGSSIHIVGALNSIAAKTYQIEFFASPTCAPSGYGEGAQFLGSAAVTTNGAGMAGIDVTLNAVVAGGSAITATATDAAGSTSEFSACISAVVATKVGDINGDGLVDLTDLATLLAAYGNCTGQPGYLPAADLDASGCVNLADLALLLAHYGE